MPLKVNQPSNTGAGAGADIEKIINNLAKENAELRSKLAEQDKLLQELTALKADSQDYLNQLKKSVAISNSYAKELAAAQEEIKVLSEIRNYFPAPAELQKMSVEMQNCSAAVRQLPGWWAWLRNSATIPLILLLGISITLGIQIYDMKQQIKITNSNVVRGLYDKDFWSVLEGTISDNDHQEYLKKKNNP